MMLTWTDFLERRPLVAILRGLQPSEAPAMADALIEAGFLCLEVPLNSPRPFESVAAMRAKAAGRAIVGAGTVLSVEDAERAVAAGAEIVISPNADAAVIGRAKALGAISLPGVFTASEAFAALQAGADALKLFPADNLQPAYLKALRAVLSAPLLPVGGVTPETLRSWVEVGAAGFGIGSALFTPGRGVEDVAARAKAFVKAWTEAKNQAGAPR